MKRGGMRAARSQRGSVMILVMVALLALLSLGSLTILSVKGGTAAAGHNRFVDVARYAAESGVAATMEFLRTNTDSSTYWSAYVLPGNTNVVPEPGVQGNGVRPGQPGNILSADMRAWYEVEIHNNEDDTGFSTGLDTDGRVTLRSTGHGPNATVAVVEVKVALDAAGLGAGVPCPAYAQKNITELGTGHNPCLGSINTTNNATFKPGP